MNYMELLIAAADALKVLRESANTLGWKPEFLNAQIELVRTSAPNTPNADIHDSALEYASAYNALFCERDVLGRLVKPTRPKIEQPLYEEDLREMTMSLCPGGRGVGVCPHCGFERSIPNNRW